MDILKFATIYQKLAQQPIPTGTTDPSKLPAGAYTGPGGEVTIVGDPNAGQGESAGQGQSSMVITPKPAQSPTEIMQNAGWKNFKVYSFYYPPKPEDRKLLEGKGWKLFPNMGLVPPNELAYVEKALAAGYKYAGPGFGLLPPNWYNWVIQQGYIKPQLQPPKQPVQDII